VKLKIVNMKVQAISKIRLSINATKYLASSYFILIAVLSLADSVYNQKFMTRDAIILAILSLPLIINKRLFYLVFGFLGALVSLPLTIVYIIYNNPVRSGDSPAFFFVGLFFYILALVASMALIHVGTFSRERNRFQLIGDDEAVTNI
jgi:hypothetical protein